MAGVDDADQTLARIDAALDQIRRDALRQVRSAARIANEASEVLGMPRVVVYLRSDDAVHTACSGSGT